MTFPNIISSIKRKGVEFLVESSSFLCSCCSNDAVALNDTSNIIEYLKNRIDAIKQSVEMNHSDIVKELDVLHTEVNLYQQFDQDNKNEYEDMIKNILTIRNSIKSCI